MPTIQTFQNVTIRDPRLKQIADGIVSAANIAAHRAIANTADASRFPIARGAATFERAVSELFARLPRAQQDSIRSKVLQRVDRATLEIPNLNLNQPLTRAEFRSTVPAENIVLSRLAVTSRLSEAEVLRWPMMFSGSIIRSPNGTPAVKTAKVGVPKLPAPTPEQQIDQKYQQLKGAQGFLGAPISGYGITPGGVGHFRHYAGGSIYFTPWTGAHEVHGAIREKWKNLGWEQSALLFPTTDELKTPDGIGRFNHFEGGSIYWTPKTGAFEVHGAILEKWSSLGWEKSVLGYPITDELITPDGIGRFNHFQYGSIYYKPQTGAHEVHGQIHEFWKAQGWELGALGYPLTDELELPNGQGRRSVFQGGTVGWNPNAGAFAATTAPISRLHLRVLKCHCIDETGRPSTGGEIGSDDIKLGGTAVSAYGEVSKFGPVDLGKYNDGTWSHWAPKVLHTFDVNQNDGIWPKGFIATMILVEKDDGGYSDFVKKVMNKVKEIVKQELAKKLGPENSALIGLIAGGPLGALVGYIAGLVAAYVVDRVFNAFKEIFDDDIFYPITVYAQLPGARALFANNTYDSEDEYAWVNGHHGKYEWWFDWAVE